MIFTNIKKYVKKNLNYFLSMIYNVSQCCFFDLEIGAESTRLLNQSAQLGARKLCLPT